MTADESADLLDNDLQSLFAPVHPLADFEDRLVQTIRQRRRLRLAIPTPIRKAAIAAAAVLAVGTVGYYGNRAITGKRHYATNDAMTVAANPTADDYHLGGRVSRVGEYGIEPREITLKQSAATAGTVTPNSNAEAWDFGGGSNSAQNWPNWNGNQKNLTSSYENPFASGKAVADGWQLKNPDAAYAIASDLNGRASGQIQGGRPSLRGLVVGSNSAATEKKGPAAPLDGMDSILLPNANGGDDVIRKQLTNAKPALDVKQPPTLSAANTYTGYTKISGGTLSLGSDAQDRSKAVSGLVQDARTNYDEGKYTDALKAVDNIKKLDPSNQYAADVHQMVEDKANNQTLRGDNADHDREYTKVLGDAKGKVIPYEDILRYSPDWPKDKKGDNQQAYVSNLTPVAGDGLVNTNAAPPAVLKQLNFQHGVTEAQANFDSEMLAQNMLGGLDTKGEKGGQAPLLAQQGQPANPVPTTAPVVDDRKIIRTGTMEFEVDRFDTAQMQITKIVGELGGFVGATDSTKLPNGKVRGSISVRVPPERLDTLVLSLRALGDLKSQQITAADITKEYTDIQSELTADRAMQDRLLELIHNGKGTVKDLLAAENELGVWRGKIEKAEGMIRYYNGQVALSTLAITLSERDIQTPATAVETETADVGIEADDVEKARTSALKAIDDVKGRVVEAELKRFDAGQLAARLVADVPPDSAGAVIDQLKLLGKVARLEIQRQQTSSDGTNPTTATTPLKTERKPTRLLISIYNLANVAPRRTTNVSLAATDVETAYTALAAAAKSNGGRVVTSALDRGDPVKATGSLVLEFPPDKFEAAMTALHAQGDVLKLTLTENPDTQNSTEAKAGLTVQLISLAAVPPRESIAQTLAATDVPAAYQAVVNAANTAHARVQSAQLNEQDRQNVTADLQLEVPRSAEVDFDKAVAAAGGTIARTSNRAAEAEGTVDSKVSLHLSITSADHLALRETTRLQVETVDVDKSTADAQAAAVTAGGRVLEASVIKDHGKGLARVILDLPLDKAGDVLQQVRGEGTVRGIDASRDPQAPSGALAHAQIFVEFTTGEAIVSDQTGPWASIRQGLSTSVAGLLWSLQWVIVGVCLIVPWFAIGWVGWKVWKRRRPIKSGV